MSIDTVALFESPDTVDLKWLRGRLVAAPGFAAEVMVWYRDIWRIKTWTLEAVSLDSTVLWGPGGFGFRFIGRLVDMYHIMRFGDFTGDAERRNALRRACLEVAGLVGSSCAIYTHELMPYEGTDIQTVESGLRARIGPPAETLEEMHEAEPFGPRAWYIDTFEDLRVRTIQPEGLA